jgi:hypothetical protein
MKAGEGRRRLAGWGARWLVLVLLWLALADSRAPAELIAAAVAAALGASLASLIPRPGGSRTMRTTARLLRLGPARLGRPLVRLVIDNKLLAEALLRRLRGKRVKGALRTVQLPSDPALRSAPGRVAIEAWASLAPNRYVIGIDEEAGTALVHELVPSDFPHTPLGGR